MYVICLNEFLIESLGINFKFERGKKYSYKLEFFDFICDEMMSIYVNNIPITKNTFVENFSFIEDWRTNQLNKIIC